MTAPGNGGDFLLPGEQPPLSHFGATLLRHVVVTGLRYSLYHLELPLPDKAPIRIERLRFRLDPAALMKLLSESDHGRAVLGALTDPAGAESASETPPVGAAFFHRQRLRWARRRRLPGAAAAGGDSVTALEYRFRKQLARCLPPLNDAMLDEVVTTLGRRRRRSRGKSVGPCLGAEAAAWTAGKKARLDCLGPPDPFQRSWAEEPPSLAPADCASHGRDGGRGRFRELYRQMLDGVRPTLLALGRVALEDGVVDHQDDLFFLPFELLDDLTTGLKPPWLPSAVLRNRAEYFGLHEAAGDEERAAWTAAAVEPLA